MELTLARDNAFDVPPHVTYEKSNKTSRLQVTGEQKSKSRSKRKGQPVCRFPTFVVPPQEASIAQSYDEEEKERKKKEQSSAKSSLTRECFEQGDAHVAKVGKFDGTLLKTSRSSSSSRSNMSFASMSARQVISPLSPWTSESRETKLARRLRDANHGKAAVRSHSCYFFFLSK